MQAITASPALVDHESRGRLAVFARGRHLRGPDRNGQRTSKGGHDARQGPAPDHLHRVRALRGQQLWGWTVRRIAYLDGIRAMAIGTVLIVHWISSQFSIGYGGYIGVDIFFVLSGYIITSMLWRRVPSGHLSGEYVRFLKRRMQRLYPALIVFVGLTLILYAIVPGAPLDVRELVGPAGLALVQGYSFYAAAGANASPFAITWSLSVEWIFYLLWPLAIFGARRSGVGVRTVMLWTGAVAAVLYAVSLFQEAHWFYYGPLARVPEIMVGGILALALSGKESRALTRSQSRLAAAAAWLSVSFVLVYTIVGPVQWSPVFRFVGLPLVVASALYLIWFGQQLPEARFTSMLSWAPLTFLGRISYSLYLWHMIGLNLFTRDNIGDLPLPIVAGLAVLTSLALALLSYRFLEVPFLKYRRRQGKEDVSLSPENEIPIRSS